MIRIISRRTTVQKKFTDSTGVLLPMYLMLTLALSLAVNSVQESTRWRCL